LNEEYNLFEINSQTLELASAVMQTNDGALYPVKYINKELKTLITTIKPNDKNAY
jgi:hypothetical protein